jgi:hypothetical protein
MYRFDVIVNYGAENPSLSYNVIEMELYAPEKKKYSVYVGIR